MCCTKGKNKIGLLYFAKISNYREGSHLLKGCDTDYVYVFYVDDEDKAKGAYVPKNQDKIDTIHPDDFYEDYRKAITKLFNLIFNEDA